MPCTGVAVVSGFWNQSQLPPPGDGGRYDHKDIVNNEPFYIAFEGAAESAQLLSGFVAEIAAAKAANSIASMNFKERGRIISDPKWVDLLNDSCIARLTDGHHWQLEDILDCMLTGEYELGKVEFSGGWGRVLYDPLAFPFGGTDPIKALVEVFGLQVTQDSFNEGYAEYEASGGS